MKATALEFRLRYPIHLLIFFLGFTAPWDIRLHLDSIRTWQFLAAWPARSGWISFSASTIAVLAFGIACAFIGAALRTWGSAYLGASIVKDRAMHGERVVAAGPYRYMRNPLYLGIFIHILALSLLMPTSGAVFTIVLVGFFEMRLILREEAFLAASLGEPYLAYCAKVPRIVPTLTPRVPGSDVRPHWGSSFLGEVYFWGAFLSFAALGWRYNSVLIGQGVLVSLGVSIIARAFIPAHRSAAE